MSKYAEGDRVTVTITGAVTHGHDGYVYLRETRSGVEYFFDFDHVTSVEKDGSTYVEGEAYVDHDGDKFLRRYDAETLDEPWVDAYGSFYRDDELTPPILPYPDYYAANTVA